LCESAKCRRCQTGPRGQAGDESSLILGGSCERVDLSVACALGSLTAARAPSRRKVSGRRTRSTMSKKSAASTICEALAARWTPGPCQGSAFRRAPGTHATDAVYLNGPYVPVPWVSRGAERMKAGPDNAIQLREGGTGQSERRAPVKVGCLEARGLRATAQHPESSSPSRIFSSPSWRAGRIRGDGPSSSAPAKTFRGAAPCRRWLVGECKLHHLWRHLADRPTILSSALPT